MSEATRNITQITRTYNKTPPYEIVIPTAGLGHRMKCYGAKSLLPIKGEITLLQYQIDMIHKHMRCDPRIIVVTGFQADKVMNHLPSNVICVENENYETTNVTRSIGMGLRASVTNNVVVMYGDLVFNKYALGFSMTEGSVLLVDNNGTMTSNEVGCIVVNNQIERLWYDLPQKWGQIAMLTDNELRLAKAICWHKSFANCFGFEVINEIIKRGGKFTVNRPHKLKINDIDTTHDLAKVNTII